MHREFHLGDLLSVSDGHLIGPNGIDGVYNVMGFIMGRELWTHELPFYANQCSLVIKHQIPFMKEIVFPEDIFGWGPVAQWLAPVVQEYGEWHAIVPFWRMAYIEQTDVMGLLNDMRENK